MYVMKKFGGLKLLKIGRLSCLMIGAAGRAASAAGTERDRYVHNSRKKVSRIESN